MGSNRKQIIKTFDLVWIVGGVVKETIMINKPRGLCFYKMNQINKTTHKTGKLEIRENK